MTVRSHVPVGVTVSVAVALLLCAAGAGYAVARLTASGEGLAAARAEATRLAEENRDLRADRDRAVESGDTADSRRTMERSTIRELGDQISKLEADNARLKEDVGFFEAATADRDRSPSGDNGGIAIRRLQVVVEKDRSLARYRILLTQDSKAARDFVGTLQLAVTLLQAGKAVNIVVPPVSGVGGSPVVDATDASPFEVVFRSYKRIDGSFAIPPDAVLKSVQVRILERGAVRVQQTAIPAP